MKVINLAYIQGYHALIGINFFIVHETKFQDISVTKLPTDSLADGWVKALSLDRKQFNMFFDRMMDGFAYHKIVLDKAGKPVDYIFLEVNAEFEKMTGLKREKIIGKRVTEVLKGIEKDPADWIGVYGKVALTCEPVQFENFAEPLGKWYNVSAYCPEKGYFVALFEDITERKKAQEELKINEERFRSVLNNASDVVYRLNLQTGRYEYMSPASKSLLGFEPEELMNMSNEEVLSRVYPEDLPKLHAELVQTDKTGRGVSEYRFKGKDGKYTWWSNQMVIIRDKDGKPLYRDGFVRNITKRKKAEQELVNAKNDWERTFDAVPDFIAILDVDYKIVRANRAMAEQLGTTPEKTVGLTCYKCVHATNSPPIFCPHAQLLKDGKQHTAEVHEPRLRGDFIVSDTPLRDEKGKLIGSVHVARDITKRKKAEESLALSNKKNIEILESIQESFFSIDRNWNYVYVNKTAAVSLGIKQEDIIGHNVWKMFPQYLGTSLEENLRAAMENRQIRRLETYSPYSKSWYQTAIYPSAEGISVLGTDITIRKKGEEALKISEQRWSTTLSSIGDAVIATDTDGKITFMNAVAEQLTGWKLNEAKQKPIAQVFKIVNEKTRQTVDNPVVKVLEKGLIIGLANHTVLIRKDGSEVSIDDSGAPIKSADGKISGVVLVFRDISERKKAEEKIAQQAFMIANANDAIIGYDMAQRVTFWNKSAERLYGYSELEALGKVGVDLFSPIYTEVSRAKLVDELAKVGHVETESIRKTKDGKSIIVEANVISLKNEIGELIGYVSVDRDITERKKTEESIRQSEERFSKAFHNNPSAMSISRLSDGKWVDVNESFLQLTEFSREEIIGQNSSALGMFDVTERAKILKTLATNGSVSNLELKAKTKSGKHVDLLFSGFIVNLNGEPHAIAMQIDITERKKSEENLRKLNRTLRAISDSNQALMRATDEKSFLQQACKIIVEDCGYQMVWVGLAENDSAKTVRPVAYFGLDEGYLKALDVTWADLPRGRGPTGRAIRTGEPQFCEDMQTDPLFKPWQKEALKRGFVSSIALPLKSGDKIFGALTLYSKEPDVCSEDEVKLLTELAGDFAHGIMLLRLRAEKEVADAQIYRQAALIDLSPDAIIVRKLDGAITSWSAGAEKLYGWTKKEAIGKSTHKLLQTKFPKPINDIMSEIKAKERWTGELVHKTKAGSEVIVQSWWLAERTEHGEITSILESNVDITERKANEKEMARLASFPTLNPNPVFEVDFNGKITYANPATKVIFPDLETLALNHPFLSDWTGVVKHFDVGATIFFGREVKVNGHWYHQQFYYVGVADRIRVYTMDIDELKQTEEERAKVQVKLEENAVLLEEYASQMEELAEQRAQQLKNAERMAAIGQTAGMVGHDIRNPLQAITSDMYLITEELKSMPEGESKQSVFESIDSVSENLTYINKIVSDLQDYNRPLKPSIQDANLAELIEGTILTINIPKRIELTTEINDNSKVIQTDIAYLRRILTNLVTNAVQAMPEEGGKLTVETTKKKDKIVICVEDTGVGIPQELKDKMFTPLFTTKSKGQGLGLAVVKRLVEALKGTITFESIPNKGTKFIVELPQPQPQPQNPK